MSGRRNLLAVVAAAAIALPIVFPAWEVQWIVVKSWAVRSDPPPLPGKELIIERDHKKEIRRALLFTGPKPPPAVEHTLAPEAKILDRRTGTTAVIMGIRNNDFRRRLLTGQLFAETSMAAAAVVVLTAITRRHARKAMPPLDRA